MTTTADTKSKRRLKIGLIASAGGHLIQLLKLSKSWQGCETFCITTADIFRDRPNQFDRTYIIENCNRRHPFRVFRAFLRCIKIIFREKPDVILSTGAAPGVLASVTGKICGSAIVWVDSIANVKKLSLSGRLIRPMADLFLTQWPRLAQRNKGIEYVGSLL